MMNWPTFQKLMLSSIVAISQNKAQRKKLSTSSIGL